MSLFHPYICRKQKGFPNAVGYPSPFTLPLVLSVLTRWKGMTGQGTAVNFELRGVRRREWLRSGCCLLSLFGILGLGFLRTGLGGGSQLSSAPLPSLHPPFFQAWGRRKRDANCCWCHERGNHYHLVLKGSCKIIKDQVIELNHLYHDHEDFSFLARIGYTIEKWWGGSALSPTGAEMSSLN